MTPFSLFYGDYTTLTYDEKPVVGTIGSKADPISCDTWTTIANSPISISQKPGIGELKRTITNSREYYDVKTKQPIKADSIWIQYGAHETGLGCNGGVDFLAFSDRGTWTTGVDSVSYKFNGTLLTKNFKNEFAEAQYGIGDHRKLFLL